jgi:hypothetical protein
MARNTNSMWLSFDTGFSPGWTLLWTMTALAIIARCRETKCKDCRAAHSSQEFPIDGNPNGYEWQLLTVRCFAVP